jgi:hypothetical protein
VCCPLGQSGNLQRYRHKIQLGLIHSTRESAAQQYRAFCRSGLKAESYHKRGDNAMSHHHRHGTPDKSNQRAFWITMAVMAAIALLWLAMFKLVGHRHLPPHNYTMPDDSGGAGAIVLRVPEIEILPPDERTVSVEPIPSPEPEVSTPPATEVPEVLKPAIGLPEPEFIKPELTKAHRAKPHRPHPARPKLHTRPTPPPHAANPPPTPPQTNEVIELNPAAS